jgi:hypothetical protein
LVSNCIDWLVEWRTGGDRIVALSVRPVSARRGLYPKGPILDGENTFSAMQCMCDVTYIWYYNVRRYRLGRAALAVEADVLGSCPGLLGRMPKHDMAAPEATTRSCAMYIVLRANQAVTRFELDYGFNSISPRVCGYSLMAKYQWHTIMTITSYQQWSSSEGGKGETHYDIDQKACFSAAH